MWIAQRLGCRTNVFDVDTVDGGDLLQEQRKNRVVREFDDELVDGPAGATFEDVDADDVTADGTDAARGPARPPRPGGPSHPPHAGLPPRPEPGGRGAAVA